MSPRNTLNAESNPTLRVNCAACGQSTPTDVSNDRSARKTWNLVTTVNGQKQTVAVCEKCHGEGWRPSAS